MTIKYTGSKRWLVNVLQPIDEIFEPFAGSAVVSLQRSTTCHLNDAVEPLIMLYRRLKTNKLSFIQDVKFEVDRIKLASDSKSEYYLMRDRYNAAGMTDPVLFATILYLGFNGLYRVGPKGCNVPYGGDNRNFNPQGLLDIPVEKIQTLSCVPWDFCHVPSDTCTVYADPPYATAFTGYTRKGWAHDDNITLFGWLAGLPNPVLISCLRTDDNEKLLKTSGFDYIVLPKKFSNGPGSVTKGEILAFNNKALPSINFREVKWTVT